MANDLQQLCRSHIPATARYFSLPQNVQADFGAHTTFYSVGRQRGIFSWGESGRFVKPTTHIHPMPRMSGSTTPLPHMPSQLAQGHIHLYLHTFKLCYVRQKERRVTPKLPHRSIHAGNCCHPFITYYLMVPNDKVKINRLHGTAC